MGRKNCKLFKGVCEEVTSSSKYSESTKLKVWLSNVKLNSETIKTSSLFFPTSLKLHDDSANEYAKIICSIINEFKKRPEDKKVKENNYETKFTK